MKNKQQTPPQTPSNVRTSLIAVAAAILVGTGLYVYSANSKTNETIDKTNNTQNSAPKESTDAYAGWKSYTWTDNGVSFKYPGDWVVNDTQTDYRVYVRNVNVDLTKESMPANFQQVWLSVDVDETAAAREQAIKNGQSDFRMVDGTVKAGSIKTSGVTVNTYEYKTLGGATLEAYWTNKAGVRLMATTSTEVGEQNQSDMVATLKKVLATVSFVE